MTKGIHSTSEFCAIPLPAPQPSILGELVARLTEDVEWVGRCIATVNSRPKRTVLAREGGSLSEMLDRILGNIALLNEAPIDRQALIVATGQTSKQTNIPSQLVPMDISEDAADNLSQGRAIFAASDDEANEFTMVGRRNKRRCLARSNGSSKSSSPAPCPPASQGNSSPLSSLTSTSREIESLLTEVTQPVARSNNIRSYSKAVSADTSRKRALASEAILAISPASSSSFLNARTATPPISSAPSVPNRKNDRRPRNLHQSRVMSIRGDGMTWEQVRSVAFAALDPITNGFQLLRCAEGKANNVVMRFRNRGERDRAAEIVRAVKNPCLEIHTPIETSTLFVPNVQSKLSSASLKVALDKQNSSLCLASGSWEIVREIFVDDLHSHYIVSAPNSEIRKACGRRVFIGGDCSSFRPRRNQGPPPLISAPSGSSEST